MWDQAPLQEVERTLPSLMILTDDQQFLAWGCGHSGCVGVEAGQEGADAERELVVAGLGAERARAALPLAGVGSQAPAQEDPS